MFEFQISRPLRIAQSFSANEINPIGPRFRRKGNAVARIVNIRIKPPFAQAPCVFIALG